jgi:uncharacterized protein
MNIKEKLSEFLERIPDASRKRRWPILTAAFLITIVAFYGMSNVKFDMTIDSWLGVNAPVKVALDELRAEFGSDDNLYIVYEPKDGNVFSAKSLEIINDIREDIINAKLKADEKSVLQHIVKVNTIVNAPVLKAEGDELVAKPLLGKTIPTDQQELAEVRKTAETQGAFPLLYFSKDMKYGGFTIETNFGTERLDEGSVQNTDSPLTMGDMSEDIETSVKDEPIRFKPTDANDYFAIMKEIKTILAKPEYKDHMQFHIVGNAAMNTENMDILESEGGPIYLGLLVVMAILIWLFARSFSAVAWSLSIVILSVIWTIGIFGLFGVTISAFVMLTVMLILTVGLCDATHVFSGYTFHRNEGFDRKKAVNAVFKASSIAMLITAFTNAIGMLANMVTPIYHIRIFSLMSAAGVIISLLLTLCVLPIMLDIWAPKVGSEANGKKRGFSIGKIFPNFPILLQNIFQFTFSFVVKRPRAILIAGCIFFGIVIYGTTKVTVDQNLATQFSESSPFRQAVEVIDKEMTGSQNMEIYLDMGKTDAFQDPFVLNKIDTLQRSLEKKFPGVIVKTSSLVETVKEANQVLNSGDANMYLIPSDQQTLSQTLYLFNNANPADRRRLVSDNYDKSHITIQLRNRGSREYLQHYETMQEDINETVTQLKTRYPDAEVKMTGLLPLNLVFADYVSSNQAQSFVFALIAITIIISFVFGSLRLGLIALIPNLIPTLVGFAVLGFAGKGLDIDVMIIIPVLIGISVDDTVHFINHYRDQIKIDGDVKRALFHTIREVGQATVFTSMIIACGFSLMAFSNITGTAYAGKLGALSIFAGLVSELFLLPAAILIFRPTFKEKTVAATPVLEPVHESVLDK